MGVTMPRNVFRLLSAAAVFALLPLAPAAAAVPAVGVELASTTTCWALNGRSGVRSGDLQVAIGKARSGDTLTVRGTCTGGFTVDKDLTLVGPATLSGGTCTPELCDAGIVLLNNGVNLRLRYLLVTNGYSTWDGGGIQNYGTLTLDSTAVAGNWAEDGAGGILNEGRLVMNGTSRVSDNWLLFGEGGGVLNRGTVVMDGKSRITGNAASEGGGMYNEGTVVLSRGATVTGNRADVGGGLLDTTGRVWFSPRWYGTLCGNTPDDWRGC